MKTTNEMIKVMEAYLDNKEIEFSKRFSNQWKILRFPCECLSPDNNPVWNWYEYDFRIKDENTIPAEEMFKQLGFDKIVDDVTETDGFLYAREDSEEEIIYIDFNFEHKTVCISWIYHNEYLNYSVSVELLKAIDSQIKELGW